MADRNPATVENPDLATTGTAINKIQMNLLKASADIETWAERMKNTDASAAKASEISIHLGKAVTMCGDILELQMYYKLQCSNMSVAVEELTNAKKAHDEEQSCATQIQELTKQLQALKVPSAAEIATDVETKLHLHVPTAAEIATDVETKLRLHVPTKDAIAREVCGQLTPNTTFLDAMKASVPTSADTAKAVQQNLAEAFAKIESSIPSAKATATAVQQNLAESFASIPSAETTAVAVQQNLAETLTSITSAETTATAVQQNLAEMLTSIPKATATAVQQNLAETFSATGSIANAVNASLAASVPIAGYAGSGLVELPPSYMVHQRVVNFWAAEPASSATIWGEEFAVRSLQKAVQRGLVRQSSAYDDADSDLEALVASLEELFLSHMQGPWDLTTVKTKAASPGYAKLHKRYSGSSASKNTDDAVPLLKLRVLVAMASESVAETQPYRSAPPPTIGLGLCLPSKHYGGFRVMVLDPLTIDQPPSYIQTQPPSHVVWLGNACALAEQEAGAVEEWKTDHWSGMAIQGSARLALARPFSAASSQLPSRVRMIGRLAMDEFGTEMTQTAQRIARREGDLSDDQLREEMIAGAVSSLSMRSRPTSSRTQQSGLGGMSLDARTSGLHVAGPQTLQPFSPMGPPPNPTPLVLQPMPQRRTIQAAATAKPHMLKEAFSFSNIGAKTNKISNAVKRKITGKDSSPTITTAGSTFSTTAQPDAHAHRSPGALITTTHPSYDTYGRGRRIYVGGTEANLPHELFPDAVMAALQIEDCREHALQTHNRAALTYCLTSNYMRYEHGQSRKDKRWDDRDGPCNECKLRGGRQCVVYVGDDVVIDKGWAVEQNVEGKEGEGGDDAEPSIASTAASATGIRSGNTFDIGEAGNLLNQHLLSAVSIKALTTDGPTQDRQIRRRRLNFERKDNLKCLATEATQKPPKNSEWDNVNDACNECKALHRQCLLMADTTRTVFLKGDYSGDLVENSATGEWYLSAQQGSKKLTAVGTCPVGRYFLTTGLGTHFSTHFTETEPTLSYDHTTLAGSASWVVVEGDQSFTFDFQQGDDVFNFIAAHGLGPKLEGLIKEGVDKVIQTSRENQAILVAKIKGFDIFD
ncbi:hypothetical protein LTR08_002485 [Meristemomyces frigidus]|nr:hypothetical protein LTR08_002485 [Meristemomyces frigidus]